MSTLNKKIALLSLIIAASSSNAYEFSFFNDTQHALGIAIQFADGDNEPLYRQLVKPRSMCSFLPGKYEIPDITWSFCLKSVFYIKNPTVEERTHAFEKATWRKAPISWTDIPLQSTKKPKKIFTKKQAPGTHHIIVKKKAVMLSNKSLCKDRHFEITENEHGNIVVTASTKE